MASKKNTAPKIDPEQKVLIERAQARARQKRRLYQHFVLFLIGAVVLIVLNVVFNIGADINPFGVNWFVWAIALWGVFLLAHIFNVFITNKFFGKDWENRQVERLVAKQHEKIEKLRQEVQKEHPLPKEDEPFIPPATEKPIDPKSPRNT